MNANEKNELVRYYLDGHTLRDTGEKFGITYTSQVRKLLLSLGIKPRNHISAALPQVRLNTCVICGTVFRPMGRKDRKTCSKDCNSKLMTEIQSGDKCSTWKGGRSQGYYQKVRRELKPDVCEVCGVTDARLDTHHIDRDRTNNTLENIQVLCVQCHAKRHYIEDDRGLRGWKGDGN